MPAQSFEFWIVFRRKNPKQLSYKTPNVCQRPLFLLLTLWGFVVLNGKTSRREKDFPAERLRWVNKMLLGSSCKWNELLQILGLSSIHLVFSLQGGRGALTFWSVWLLALFFKSSTGKEWLESFLRVLIQDYLSALLVNSHGVLTALLKCYNTKYSPYPTLNEVN